MRFCVFLALILALANFNCLCRADDEYQGPRLDKLIGYWPLDAFSELDEYSTTFSGKSNNLFLGATVENAEWARPVLGEKGPFNRLGTAYSCLVSNQIIASYPEAVIPANFTISFYFYKASLITAQDIALGLPTIAKFGSEPPESGTSNNLFTIFYGNQIQANNRANASLSKFSYFRRDLRQNEWAFYAVTSSQIPKFQNVTIFDKDGRVLENALTSEGVSQSPFKGFQFGTLNPKDRLACLILYGEVLLPAEIAQLPCVCENKGRCPNGRPNRLRHYDATYPGAISLVGYWPLVGAATELDEMTRGLSPDSLSMRKIEARSNPPITIFASAETDAQEDKWVAEYWDISKKGVSLQDFTVVMMLYIEERRDFSCNGIRVGTWSFGIQGAFNWAKSSAGGGANFSVRATLARVGDDNNGPMDYPIGGHSKTYGNEKRWILFSWIYRPKNPEGNNYLYVGPAKTNLKLATVCVSVFSQALSNPEIERLGDEVCPKMLGIKSYDWISPEDATTPSTTLEPMSGASEWSTDAISTTESSEIESTLLSTTSSSATENSDLTAGTTLEPTISTPSESTVFETTLESVGPTGNSNLTTGTTLEPSNTFSTSSSQKTFSMSTESSTSEESLGTTTFLARTEKASTYSTSDETGKESTTTSATSTTFWETIPPTPERLDELKNQTKNTTWPPHGHASNSFSGPNAVILLLASATIWLLATKTESTIK